MNQLLSSHATNNGFDRNSTIASVLKFVDLTINHLCLYLIFWNQADLTIHFSFFQAHFFYPSISFLSLVRFFDFIRHLFYKNFCLTLEMFSLKVYQKAKVNLQLGFYFHYFMPFKLRAYFYLYFTFHDYYLNLLENLYFEIKHARCYLEMKLSKESKYLLFTVYVQKFDNQCQAGDSYCLDVNLICLCLDALHLLKQIMKTHFVFLKLFQEQESPFMAVDLRLLDYFSIQPFVYILI